MLRTYDEIWQARQELGGVRIDALGGYVDKNTFPASIRGTVRDAVSYFAVALLGNTSYWRADESERSVPARLRQAVGRRCDGDAAPRRDGHAPARALGRGARRSGELARTTVNATALEGAPWRGSRRCMRHFPTTSGTGRRCGAQARLADARDELVVDGHGATGAALHRSRRFGTKAHQLASDGEKAIPKPPAAALAGRCGKEIEAPRLGSPPWRRMVRASVARAQDPQRHPRLLSGALRPRPRRGAALGVDQSPAAGAELQLLLASHALVEDGAVLPPSSDYRTHRTFITPPLDKLGCTTSSRRWSRRSAAATARTRRLWMSPTWSAARSS